MKTTLYAILAIVLAASSATLTASEGHHDHGASPVESILRHYEAIRLALVEDKTDGVDEHARQIQSASEALVADFEPEAAGFLATDLEEAEALLTTLASAAAELAASADIDGARAAFYALSKPLVRLHGQIDGERPVVAFCSMDRKSWLQPAGEIGNPYFGQSMARCGEVVSE